MIEQSISGDNKKHRRGSCDCNSYHDLIGE